MLLCFIAAAAISQAYTTWAADASGTDGPSCPAVVTRFLQAPTDASVGGIRNVSDRCWSALTIDDYQRLDRLVETGNERAALLLAPHVRQLDGGELEDALRALGQFASHHMRDFVESVSASLTDYEFTDALTMLPLDLDDDLDAQLEEMRARRASLNSIAAPQSLDRRRAGIAEIDKCISEMERAKSEVSAKKH